MYVLTPGASSLVFSEMCEYSPSKPTTRILSPTATPCAERVAGFMPRPRNAVMSAAAIDGTANNAAEVNAATMRVRRRLENIPHDSFLGMDLRPTSQQVLLRRTVREFAETEIGPHVMEWDEAEGFPDALVGKMAQLGLMGIQFPDSLGGAGMSAIEYCICIEELARMCPAVSLSVAAHNGLCTAHLNMFGTDAQRQQYVVPL